MSRLRANITMSPDGFVVGPDQSESDPLGVGGMEQHHWFVALKAFRETHGEEGGEVNASTPIAEGILGNVGATVMGRNMFGGRALTRRPVDGLEHAGVGVSCAEEALLPVDQSLAAGEERQQGPAAVFDAHERDDRRDREDVRRFHEEVRRPWSVMELISVRQP